MVGTLDNTNNVLTINLGKYEKKLTYINFIQYNLDRDIVDNINQILFRMNREEYLAKTFPLKDGTTYIQSVDKSNEMKNFIEWMRVNDTPENAEKYFHYTDEDMFNEYLNEPKGAGVGGESLKENFIDSASFEQRESVEQKENSADWMYNWIRKHSKK